MKNRTWILIFTVAAALCAAGFFLLPRPDGGDTALIYKDGALIESIDLSKVTEPYTITLNWEGRENVISVGPGYIAITQAGCPDQICVKHGPLAHGAMPIVCLPNRVVIKWAKDAVADAVA